MHREEIWPAKLKKTKQRELVLGVLKASSMPLSATDIEKNLESRGTPVSLSTVYRVLDSFTAHGVAKKTAAQLDGTALYETTSLHHRHYAVCLLCGVVIPVESCPLESWVHGLDGHFEVIEHDLRIYGYCKCCRTVGRKNQKSSSH